MLWLLLGGHRARDHNGIQEVASANFMSVRLAPSTTTAKGIPRPSLNWLRLVPRLPRWSDWRRSRLHRKEQMPHHPVHALPLLGNAFQFVIFLQSGLLDALKHALLLPKPKAIIDRGAGSQFPGQRIPLMPFRSTYKMADNICRSSSAGRLPLGWAGRSGINGRRHSHTASLSSHGRVRFIGDSFIWDFLSLSQDSE
jgi:hypothetical protein